MRSSTSLIYVILVSTLPSRQDGSGYHPFLLLKLYIYGYLNRVQSSRRLERETLRNVEVMWLLGRLSPDHKTIADFRKDNGEAIRKVCAQFVELCRRIGLLATASVAIDGSKFKAVNNRDRNFTKAKMERRKKQIEESISRYLNQLDSADRQEPSEAITSRVTRLKEKIGKLKEEMTRLKALEEQMLAAADERISLTDPDARSMATGGKRLFPSEVVQKIRAGGDRDKFGDGFPTLAGGSYTSQWWVFHNDHRAFAARGVHGQTIYVDPTAEMVLVRYASFPKAQNGFIDPTSLPAYQAIAEYLLLKG